MAQGMDDVDEARTSRQLDSVLETVGMDCNPGYGRSPDAIPPDTIVVSSLYGPVRPHSF